ncbi:hypothetical protein GQX74_011706 [Glossina fuscipes]|nr:hypothetical protein GQX74_011706 [Glossina fuscipes]
MSSSSSLSTSSSSPILAMAASSLSIACFSSNFSSVSINSARFIKSSDILRFNSPHSSSRSRNFSLSSTMRCSSRSLASCCCRIVASRPAAAAKLPVLAAFITDCKALFNTSGVMVGPPLNGSVDCVPVAGMLNFPELEASKVFVFENEVPSIPSSTPKLLRAVGSADTVVGASQQYTHESEQEKSPGQNFDLIALLTPADSSSS